MSNNALHVYFDVDETLVLWNDGVNWSAHDKHVEALKQHHYRGHTVVVWSAGGNEWAAQVVEKLKIQKYVTYILAKPSWFYDDLKADSFMPECNRVYLSYTCKKKKE